jgi:NAD(P)-dependent dehydrogenase (short-subunit alcohol dehydrogenase family)
MTAEGIILVTGGSRGIGAATSALLAGNGRRVVIVDIHRWKYVGRLWRTAGSAERVTRIWS